MPSCPASDPARPLSNAEIAYRLAAYAAALQGKEENPYKVRAYRTAAETIKGLRESIDTLVRAEADVTRFPGIGKGIAAALKEIVISGTLGQLELPLAGAAPEIAAAAEYPSLDPKKVARVFKKLGINTVTALKAQLEAGAIAAEFGTRMADHFRNAFRETNEILLDDADILAAEIGEFLLKRCGATRVEPAGALRRRVETVSEIALVVATDDFPKTAENLAKFRGGLDVIEGWSATSGRAGPSSAQTATYQIPGSLRLRIDAAEAKNWGSVWITVTGSSAHLDELKELGTLAARGETEEAVYAKLRLAWVPPELREGRGEVAQAARDELPQLVEVGDIRGDLHMHTTSSDGVDSLEAMAEAAQARGYEYIGITDHSQSLRIARGVSIADLRKQNRAIDRLNGKLKGIRILKSAEVDILADGSLDYPDDLLAELDYTICSIHSRFQMKKAEQTERLLRAMDHPSFTILGHATGRVLLHRTGYEIDLPRLIEHAKTRGCYFEINADPDRLDLSSDNVRTVAAAGIKVAVCTDAHRVTGMDYMHCGIDVARRAGLTKEDVLNTRSLTQLTRALRR